MNENIKNSTMYETIPAVSGLNKVPGFDPRKFMRKITSELTKQETLYLDLKYKRLWFRLVYPKGQIKKTALTITEKIAIIEAKIFFNKNDAEPDSTFIAQWNAGDNSDYIKNAQDAAEYQALTDAGFGIQFCDILQGPDTEILDAKITGKTVNAENITGKSVIEKNPAAETDEKIPPVTENEKQENITPVLTNTIPSNTAVDKTNESKQNENLSAPQTANLANIAVAANITAAQPKNEITGQPTEPAEQETAEIKTTVSEIVEQPDMEIIDTSEPQYDITQDLGYTADMPVNEILKVMTLAEAGLVTVDVGTCKGWMMSDVMEKRPASLKWYLNGYTGTNNILRAAAKMMLDYMGTQRAAA